MSWYNPFTWFTSQGRPDVVSPVVKPLPPIEQFRAEPAPADWVPMSVPRSKRYPEDYVSTGTPIPLNYGRGPFKSENERRVEQYRKWLAENQHNNSNHAAKSTTRATNTTPEKKKKQEERRDDSSDLLLGAAVGYALGSSFSSTPSRPADTYEAKETSYSGGGSTVSVDDDRDSSPSSPSSDSSSTDD